MVSAYSFHAGLRYLTALSLIRAIFILIVLILPELISGQSLEIRNDKNMLNFWIGDWEVFWVAKDSVIHRGENSVVRILDDHVIKENFVIETGPNKGFIGKSWSVYNPRSGKWNQTWVDNRGGYLDFEGDLKEDSVIFKRGFRLDSTTIRHQRMVFFNIRNDGFQWLWQHKDDNREQESSNWVDDWLINYQRKE